MSLGDHLGSHEDVDLAFSKTAEHALEVPNVLHRVPVDAPNPRIRKQFPKIGLDALGALPDIIDVFALALRTLRRGALAPVRSSDRAAGRQTGDRSSTRCRTSTER